MDLESLLFGSTAGQRTSMQTGDILVAEPLMTEVFFKMSAILVLASDQQKGTFGLVMNHELNVSLRDLIPEWANGDRVKLHSGGPVDLERLFMLHTLGDYFKGSQPIAPGLYIGANIDDVIEYVDAGGPVEGKLRFFLGYSGWDANQLESEILRHSWGVGRMKSPADLLEGTGDAYWRRQVEHLGENFRNWLMVPPDIAMN
ncbi:MAG: YqgE/AlgH family protein [Muribaculaceae bacterium]|nr:YqgE/AlgH family protein [Muribaculaceae bacterium]